MRQVQERDDREDALAAKQASSKPVQDEGVGHPLTPAVSASTDAPATVLTPSLRAPNLTNSEGCNLPSKGFVELPGLGTPTLVRNVLANMEYMESPILISGALQTKLEDWPELPAMLTAHLHDKPEFVAAFNAFCHAEQARAGPSHTAHHAAHTAAIRASQYADSDFVHNARDFRVNHPAVLTMMGNDGQTAHADDYRRRVLFVIMHLHDGQSNMQGLPYTPSQVTLKPECVAPGSTPRHPPPLRPSSTHTAPKPLARSASSVDSVFQLLDSFGVVLRPDETNALMRTLGSDEPTVGDALLLVADMIHRAPRVDLQEGQCREVRARNALSSPSVAGQTAPFVAGALLHRGACTPRKQARGVVRNRVRQ